MFPVTHWPDKLKLHTVTSKIAAQNLNNTFANRVPKKPCPLDCLSGFSQNSFMDVKGFNYKSLIGKSQNDKVGF